MYCEGTMGSPPQFGTRMSAYKKWIPFVDTRAFAEDLVVCCAPFAIISVTLNLRFCRATMYAEKLDRQYLDDTRSA